MAHWPRLDYMSLLTHSVARGMSIVCTNLGRIDLGSQLPPSTMVVQSTFVSEEILHGD